MFAQSRYENRHIKEAVFAASVPLSLWTSPLNAVECHIPQKKEQMIILNKYKIQINYSGKKQNCCSCQMQEVGIKKSLIV